MSKTQLCCFSSCGTTVDKAEPSSASRKVTVCWPITCRYADQGFTLLIYECVPTLERDF